MSVVEIDVPFPYNTDSACTILELTRTRCHWPLGDHHTRPPYMYCGKHTAENLPYCPGHAKLAYNKPHIRVNVNRSYNRR